MGKARGIVGLEQKLGDFMNWPWPFITCRCGHVYWAHWFKTTKRCAHCNCSKLEEK